MTARFGTKDLATSKKVTKSMPLTSFPFIAGLTDGTFGMTAKTEANDTHKKSAVKIEN